MTDYVACVCAPRSAWICLYVCAYVCTCVHACVRMYVCVCVRVRVCVRVCDKLIYCQQNEDRISHASYHHTLYHLRMKNIVWSGCQCLQKQTDIDLILRINTMQQIQVFNFTWKRPISDRGTGYTERETRIRKQAHLGGISNGLLTASCDKLFENQR